MLSLYFIVTDGIISLIGETSSPKIIAKANNTAITKKALADDGFTVTGDYFITTLSGIVYAAADYFLWNEQLVMVPGTTGIPALWPNPPPAIVRYITNYDTWGDGDCAPAWKDPRDDIVAGFNEISEC